MYIYTCTHIHICGRSLHIRMFATMYSLASTVEWKGQEEMMMRVCYRLLLTLLSLPRCAVKGGGRECDRRGWLRFRPPLGQPFSRGRRRARLACYRPSLRCGRIVTRLVCPAGRRAADPTRDTVDRRRPRLRCPARTAHSLRRRSRLLFRSLRDSRRGRGWRRWLRLR